MFYSTFVAKFKGCTTNITDAKQLLIEQIPHKLPQQPTTPLQHPYSKQLLLAIEHIPQI